MPSRGIGEGATLFRAHDEAGRLAPPFSTVHRAPRASSAFGGISDPS